MTGKLLAAFTVIMAIAAGIGVYYTQVHAYYYDVAATDEQAVMRLISLNTGAGEDIPVEDFRGVDTDTSPMRFRACFTVPLSLATLTETYEIRDDAVPLVTPGWFDCFDADEIDQQLTSGEAVAFQAEQTTDYGVDRIVAVLPDGRGFAWQVLNECGDAVFSGKDAPDGCPPPPDKAK